MLCFNSRFACIRRAARFRIRLIWIICVVLVSSALLPHGSGEVVSTGPALVDEVWNLLHAHFFDPDRVRRVKADLGDVATGDTGHGQEASAKARIKEVLQALDASHTDHYTPDSLEYFEALDIYARALGDAMTNVVGEQGVEYTGIEIVTQQLGGRTFVRTILAGGPAHEAGLLVGDELIEADGKPFHPIRSFDGRAGEIVHLTIRRHDGEPPQEVRIVPRKIKPQDSFLRALRDSARMIETSTGRIAYVHVHAYTGQAFHDEIINLMTVGRLNEADGLILDLRGGWGGASPEFAKFFIGRAPELTMIRPDGQRITFGGDDAPADAHRWGKPLVALVDAGTRSGKEALAYAFKKADVPLVGSRTAGAVLGGRPFLLSDTSLLVIATADVLVDGVRLEGIGVEPTHVVDFDIRYAADVDTQLNAAIKLMTSHE